MQPVVKQYEPAGDVEYVEVLAVVPVPTVCNIGEPVPDDDVFIIFNLRVDSSP